MNVCTHTGVSVPECSCRACLQAQIERHMPSVHRTGRTPRMESGIDALLSPGSLGSPSRGRAFLSRLRRPRLRRAA
jgi:phosphoribosyl 1,2-cyclic phosphodiesterase